MKRKQRRSVATISRADVVAMAGLVAEMDPAPYRPEIQAIILRCQAIVKMSKAAAARGTTIDLELARD